MLHIRNDSQLLSYILSPMVYARTSGARQLSERERAPGQAKKCPTILAWHPETAGTGQLQCLGGRVYADGPGNLPPDSQVESLLKLAHIHWFRA